MDKETREIMEYMDSMLDSMNMKFDHIDGMLDSILETEKLMSEKLATSNSILASAYDSLTEEYRYIEEKINAIEEMENNVIPFKNADEVFEDILDE